MNKASRYLSRILLNALFAFLICMLNLTPVKNAKADGAPPPEPDMGGVAPYHPIDTNVQMMSETVVIDALPSPTRWTSTEFNWNANQVKVHASFTLRNQGKEEEKMQVIFPLTRLDYPWVVSSYNIIGSTFVASVNGKPVPTTSVTTPPELQAVPEGLDSELPDGFFVPDVQWAGFDVTFPVQDDVIVEVEYDMYGDITTGLHRVDYILETGAGWYGNILSADIILHLPYPATSESVPETPDGCTFSGNEVQCNRKNFEPKRKDNLTFGFIDTNRWTPTLELRSRVEQYPDDADAWYRLGGNYYSLGMWWEDVIIDQHMVDLSLEAYEKAIMLRPDWGDAHFQLAKVLWYNNPKYRRGFGGGAIQKDLTVDDPLVQRSIQELKLSLSYGVSYNLYPDGLVAQMSGVIPDLQSMLPALPKSTAIPAQPTEMPVSVFDTLQKVNVIASGNYHTCILNSGEIKCKGWNVESDVPGAFVDVEAGDFYACMLTSNGGVKCMGKNNYGQLGDGTTIDRDSPIDVIGLNSGVFSIVVGDNHTCALLINGSVKCWGRNYFGELGDGTTAYSVLPVDVKGLFTSVEKLVAGSDHTCAFMVGGGIKCWGANEAGQLGDGTRIDRIEPVDVIGLPDKIIELSAGYTHTCGLDLIGDVLCWGDNSHGQLGAEDGVIHTTPVIVSGLERDIVKLAVGKDYSCGLTSKSSVKCWGRKQLYPDPSGNGIKPPEQSVPYDVPELSNNVMDVTAGNDHVCALLQNGRVKCWGLDWFAYNGPEAQFEDEPISTPSLSPLVPTPTYALIPNPNSTSTETSTPMLDLEWDLGLMTIIGVLFLIIKRSKSRKIM